MAFFNPDYQTLNDSNSSDISFEASRIFKTSSPVLTILLTIVALLMSLFTTIGNILVIFAFIFEKKLQKYSNYFILNLSIADLLIGILIAAYLALNMYSIRSMPAPQNWPVCTWEYCISQVCKEKLEKNFSAGVYLNPCGKDMKLCSPFLGISS